MIGTKAQKNTLKILLLGVFSVFLAAMTAFAGQSELLAAENPDFIQGRKLFFQARQLYYNAEIPPQKAQELLKGSIDFLNQLPDDYEKYYWQSQVQFVRGEIAENSGDKKLAAQSFTGSGQLAGQAIKYNSKSSDARRIQADTIMRLMDYKGAMYAMTQGSRCVTLLKDALELDTHNYTAMNSLGVYYINAPAIGGGSVDKGIDILRKALEGKDEFDNFISNVWLGTAFQKKKNSAEAVKYYNTALAIYPNNPWAKGLVKEVEKK